MEIVKDLNIDHKESNSLFNEGVGQTNEALSILLEQYKVYVESANRTSGFRNQANTFFLTINTMLVGFVAGILELVGQPSMPVWIVFACLAGIILSLSWLLSIRSYQALNSGRFFIIQELETRLSAQIYRREWELITGRNPVKRKYIRQSIIEQVIPLTFVMLYVGFIITLLIV